MDDHQRSHRTARLLLALCLLSIPLGLMLFVQQPPPARAAGPWYVAPSGSDSNDCLSAVTACGTINGAIGKASSGDTILVATGTYTGTGTEVVLVNKNATLSGGWDSSFSTQSGMSTIDGQVLRRGITVSGTVTVTVDRFVVQNGFAPVFSGGGGGISNSWGNLTVSNSAIISNTSSYPTGGAAGGGIYNVSGILNVMSSTISGNVGDFGGGGIYNASSGAVIITGSIISGNTAGKIGYSGGGGGGGISNMAGNLVITNSTISGNILLGGFSGSGIFAWGTNTLNNSTVSGNINGEGIYLFVATVNLNNTTVVANQGYGINNQAGTVNLKNSILANNSNSDCRNDLSYSGTVNSLGYNLIRNNANCTLLGSDLTNADPQLGPLQNNGGPTLTHALMPGSAAINGGNPAGCTDNLGNPLNTDQRGFPRFGRCDIGAYELQPIEFSTKSVSPTTASPGASLTYTIALSNPGVSDLTGVSMTDTLPVGISYTSSSLTASSGSYGFASGVITWTGTVSAATTININFGATVNFNAPPGNLVNAAVINGGGEVFTRTASTNIPLRLLYLPLIKKCPSYAEIYGRVTFNGAAASGISLALRFYNGSSWSTLATTATDSNGNYSFTCAPSLGAGQYYYVRYLNNVDNSKLYRWNTRVLSSYTAGSSVAIGDFDIANIPLVSPSPGATVPLPQTFQWTRRTATPSDSYEFDLFYPANPTLNWYTPPLGYVNNYTLNSLPPGFSTFVQYGWYIAVYSPDGGYGESFYYRTVTFSSAGAGPALRAPIRLSPIEREAPHSRELR